MTEARKAHVVLFGAVLAAIFLLFAMPVHAAEPDAPGITFDQALSICREAMFGDNAAAMKRFKALSENDRRNVDVACTAYAHGIQDYISASRSAGMRASELRSRS